MKYRKQLLLIVGYVFAFSIVWFRLARFTGITFSVVPSLFFTPIAGGVLGLLILTDDKPMEEGKKVTLILGALCFILSFFVKPLIAVGIPNLAGMNYTLAEASTYVLALVGAALGKNALLLKNS